MTTKQPIPAEVYKLPTTTIIKDSDSFPGGTLATDVLITGKLRDLGIKGKIHKQTSGPVLITYEFVPDRIGDIPRTVSLAEDLALALRVENVRVHQLPERASVGIEVPNPVRRIVGIGEILDSPAFQNSPSKLTIGLGQTTDGKPFVVDLEALPHLLIAGATGSGKTACLNALIASLLFKASPQEVKLVLIDPHRTEYSAYQVLPHLLTPIIHTPHTAVSLIEQAVEIMEVRYNLFAEAGVKGIEAFNQAREASDPPMPRIVILVDEFAELMMAAAKNTENSVARLAARARAVGIHLVFATQIPSIDVITGMIKNAFPSRIAFRVASKIDSRIILDTTGAEKLLGRGDMLFLPPGSNTAIRLHGAFISPTEITRLVSHCRRQAAPEYDERLAGLLIDERPSPWEEDGDEHYDTAVELILQTGQASASYLQRRLKIGYARASRLIDIMESEGILSPSEGSRPRRILMSLDDWRSGRPRA